MVTININKGVVFCLVFVISFFSISYVIAQWNPAKPVWHDADDLKVSIKGVDKSLQEAINDGSISSGGGSVGGRTAPVYSWAGYEVSTNDGSNWNTMTSILIYVDPSVSSKLKFNINARNNPSGGSPTRMRVKVGNKISQEMFVNDNVNYRWYPSELDVAGMNTGWYDLVLEAISQRANRIDTTHANKGIFYWE